jgi:CelD/BcsL family acetyltransferase involved in cellulose biosynthesis
MIKSSYCVQIQSEIPVGLTDNRNAVGLRVSDRSSLQTIDVATVDPLYDPTNWDRLVYSHPDFNFFHTAAWTKVLCKTYGHIPLFLHVTHAGKSLALLPFMEINSPFTGRRGVSLPFSDFCEPLVFGRWGQEALIEVLLQLGRSRKWRYFELRGGRKTLPASAAASIKYYGHKLDLTVGVEGLFARFESSARRAIRKAEKSGLAVEAANTYEAMQDFYQLHVRTRRRHGLPPQPWSFFLNIHEEVIRAGLGFITLVKSGARLVAAAVFFYSGGTALYKFGASDERIQELRGNNLVMWEGIKRLAGIGLKTLHFGRTSLSKDGLRRFKLSWGTEEEMIEYFRFAIGPDVWVNSRDNAHAFHNRLFCRLPLPINRLAGALIYPHLD